MNQKLLDNDPDYHKITSSELISFKTYLPKIQNSFSIIKKHFIGKIKTYIYAVNNREIRSLPVTIQNRHFMHLCGVKYTKGASGFVKDLKNNRLNLNELYLKEDGSTFQKLEVIDKINLLDTLETTVSIGNNMARIHYDNLLRTKANILGIVVDTDDNGINFPLSLLNISATDLHTLTRFKVFAILEENKSTHVKRCLLKDKSCTKKLNEYIDQLLNVPKKGDC
ncbi:PBECR4 domain-containing protein [Pediococcus pentosaceus]|uniref:PBECR4 domain-containing protein n=1 Tax=Pediococcus pentosaceus TaxID=1255 RepID=UPI00077C19CA|nr:PBECR4 domain-containing protein [Pediococcus pentosaceus]UQB01698.1 PBECR4 domain-containing protein [Pediococcus pentosaceus]UQB03614.1 PBECR4 domain-containing protein [Pediococcus pentosaceus]